MKGGTQLGTQGPGGLRVVLLGVHRCKGSMRSRRGLVELDRVVRLRRYGSKAGRAVGEEQCPRPAEMLLNRRGQQAAEEDRAAWIDLQQHSARSVRSKTGRPIR